MCRIDHCPGATCDRACGAGATRGCYEMRAEASGDGEGSAMAVGIYYLCDTIPTECTELCCFSLCPLCSPWFLCALSG